MSRQIPTEIRSGARVFKNIYFTDLIIILAYWMFMDTFKAAVHPALSAPYTVFNLAMGVFFALPSAANPGRKNIVALYMYLMRDAKTYHAIETLEAQGMEGRRERPHGKGRQGQGETGGRQGGAGAAKGAHV